MKLAYPVDNEQIFLPHNIIQKGIYKNGEEDYNPDENPDDEGGDETDPDWKNTIHIRFTPIPTHAMFLANYFTKGIGEENICDIVDAFIEVVKMHTDLKDGPIALIDPACNVNNFACAYEYDAKANMHEISIKRVPNIDDYQVLYLSDSKLVPTIIEVLKRHKIYYVDYDKYYIVTFCAIYTLYDYIRNHKDRTIATDKYKTSWNEFEKNTIVARRPVLLDEG